MDKILAEHGHIALQLLPYHWDFNPIENTITQLKGCVGARFVDMHLTIVTKLL